MRTVLAALILLSFSSHGQIVEDSIFTKYQDNTMELVSLSFKDSLFLKIKYPGWVRYQYFWHLNDGTHHEVDLKELDGAFILAITKKQNSITYYFLSKNSKTIEVSYLEVQNDGTKVFSKNPIAIEGKFLGSYTNKTLHILTFNKKEKFLLTDTEIDGGLAIGETNFPLSINPSKYKRHEIAFIPEDSYQSPIQAKARVKIYNRKDELVILADDPWDEYRTDQNNSFTTTIVRINKQSKETITKVFFEQRQGSFRSAVWGNYLIKLINETHNEVDGFELEVIQLNTMSKIIQHLPFSRINKIQRFGDSNRTINFPNSKKLDRGSRPPFVLIDSLDNKLVLTLGATFPVQSPTITGAPLGLAGAVAGLLLTAALREASWGKSNQLYTYLAGDLKSDFVEIDPKQFTQGIIDQYEIAKDEAHQKFDYKGYILFNENIYCLYKSKKSNFIKMVSFPKTVSSIN